jgi:quinoprotein glucose dehydrogenase
VISQRRENENLHAITPMLFQEVPHHELRHLLKRLTLAGFGQNSIKTRKNRVQQQIRSQTELKAAFSIVENRMNRFVLVLALLAEGAAAQSPQMDLHKWSGEINVPDPVAVTVDPQGRVYVTATTRRKVADLDIREHQLWIPDDVALDSVEAKRAFYQRELAPGKLRVPRGSLKDHNGDGSIDWKDLTVHSERIYQLRDDDGDGTADRITVFAEGFNTEVTGIAAGVLYHDGWVYATIAPDLWRLKDTDDDGVADVREVVAHGFGMHIAYAGHDMHGLRLGPDGRIYWTIGDKGVNVTSKEGNHFYYPHEGCVLRMEPDGSGFEVFARGLRNVQEVAFDEWGNLFGVDNDADMTGEKERVVHIVEGSDSGWRCGHQYMKGDSRWVREGIWQTAHPKQPLFVLPPIALSRNGPAGFLWEPGTALGADLRGKFFLNQFPSGELTALTLQPQGASFVQTAEQQINKGVMGIGMAWGPDGAIYMADWDGGYPLDEKGGVWRVDQKGGKDNSARATVATLLKAGFVHTELPDLQALLGHPDQRVRVEAQLEMVKRGAFAELAQVALNLKASDWERVHAMWGYGIGMRRGQVTADALATLASDVAPQVRAQWCKMLGDAPKVGAVHVETMLPLLTDQDPAVRVQAAIALGKLKGTQALPSLLKMAAKDAADPVLRHAVVMGLTGAAKPADLAKQAAAPSVWQRAASLLALRQQRAQEVALFLQDADPRLVDEAARAIHDDEAVPAAWSELAALLDTKRSFSEMTQRRALNTAFRLGGQSNAKRLVRFVLNEDAQRDLREQALQHLAEWVDVPRLDRVDGMAHNLTDRDASGAKEALAAQVESLLALTGEGLKAAAIQALVAMAVPVTAEAMVSMVTDEAAADEVRAAALKMMAAQHETSPKLDAVLEAVWQSKSDLLKETAMEVQVVSRPAVFLTRMGDVLEKEKKVRLKQLAFALCTQLKGIEQEAASTLVGEWMQRLAAGKVAAELQLDILEAAGHLATSSPALAEALAAHEARRPAPKVGANGIPVLSLPNELLKGGDRVSGREIVTHHLGGNCLACHVVEASGGSNVGPTLAGIGKLKNREYLLESLLHPGAIIAPGYGMVSISLKDGRSLAGTLLKEGPEGTELKATDGTLLKLAPAEIANQTPPISVMPPMLGLLTKMQIRDVVEYLSSLTKLPKATAGH